MAGGAHRGRPTGLVWQHHEHPRSVPRTRRWSLRNAPVNARRVSAHPGVGRPSARRKKEDGRCRRPRRYLGADPTVVRVLVIVPAVFGGAGSIIYLAMWLIVPQEP